MPTKQIGQPEAPGKPPGGSKQNDYGGNDERGTDIRMEERVNGVAMIDEVVERLEVDEYVGRAVRQEADVPRHQRVQRGAWAEMKWSDGHGAANAGERLS